MTYTLDNSELTLTVTNHGAEIRSLVDNVSGREYMWQADPTYWPRTAPVLFPLVGNYRDKMSIYDGREYHLNQHGFARDMDFMVLSHSDNEIMFTLKDTPETLEKYPFHFLLTISYQLIERSVRVTWTVTNPNPRPMFFSIGGHPAFNCSLDSDYLRFDTDKDLTSGVICNDGSGCLSDKVITVPLQGGILKLNEEMFDDDALIIEHEQASRVEILDREKNPYLAVSFDAPLFGIWSPARKNAPFICIEPWFGRCDRYNFNHQLAEREYGIELAPSRSWQRYYTISV